MVWVYEYSTRPGEGRGQARKSLGGHALSYMWGQAGEGFKERHDIVAFVTRKVTGCRVEGTRQAAGRQVGRADLEQVLWEVEISRGVWEQWSRCSKVYKRVGFGVWEVREKLKMELGIWMRFISPQWEDFKNQALSSVHALIHFTFKTTLCIIDGTLKHREVNVPKAQG